MFAFRLFLLIADEIGEETALSTTGYFYDNGIGVRRNKTKAMYWYKRAYRAGSGTAAINVGLMFRQRGEATTALRWFRRALVIGEHEAALNIAQIYAGNAKPRLAAGYLRFVLQAKHVTESTREEASAMLNQLRLGDRPTRARRHSSHHASTQGRRGSDSR